MEFQRIDRRSWPRDAYFNHYFHAVPCTYSMTVKLDITPIRQQGVKLYPAMLYALCTVVNRHAEFRTSLDEAGNVGVFSDMVPCYTIFHKDSETFSNIWTEYHPRFSEFLRAYQQDLQRYGQNPGLEAKPGTPANSFPVSMIPWTTFDGFNLNLPNGAGYLLPIFTMGKFYQQEDRYWLPLSVQVHHGVCDGFHLCRFINELQELIRQEGVFAAGEPV